MIRKIYYASVFSSIAFTMIFAWTFLPENLPVNSTAAPKLPETNIPEGIKIKGIKTGTISSTAAFAYRGGSFLDKRTTIVGSFLIEHPKGKLLIDAGFGKNINQHKGKAMHWLMRSLAELKMGKTVAEQLKKAEISQDDIKGVILTHSHWDHTSGLEDMPEIPVFLPGEEIEFIKKGEAISSVARQIILKNHKSYQYNSGSYMGFPKSHDFYKDGSIIIVPSPGHTPGSVIIFVNVSSGKRYAIIGDLVWLIEGIQRPAERPWISRNLVDENRKEIKELLVKMHKISKSNPELIIVPVHDAGVWQKLPLL